MVLRALSLCCCCVQEAPTLRGASVLVTGGAGFVGSHLVDRLVDKGPRRIAVLDNLWIGSRENLNEARRRHAGVRLYEADATSLTAFRDVLRRERVDVVFDLATWPLPASLTRPRQSAEQISRMATVAAELCRLGEFQTLVHCSSSEAYGTAQQVPMTEQHPLNPETPYAAGKAAADLVIRSYWETFDIDATIVRPFNTYGPRQADGLYPGVIPATLRRIRDGKAPIIFGDGQQTRDYTFVTDTADALIGAYLAPQTRRRVINVGSGTEISIGDLVTTIARLAGHAVAPVHVDERKADVRRLVADTTLARELFGFVPRVPLDEGLRRTVKWYLGRPRRASRR